MIFILENWTFYYDNVVTVEIRFSLSPGFDFFWLLKAVVLHLFHEFTQLFLQRMYSLPCVVTDNCSLTHVQILFWQRFPWISGARKRESLCRLALCWDSPTGWPVDQPKVEELMVFSGSFWVSILPSSCVWLSKFREYIGDFKCSNFPRKFSPQLSLLGIKQSVVCLNSNLLFQASVDCWSALQCFQAMPAAFPAWGRSRLGKTEFNTLHQSQIGLEKTYTVMCE